MVMVVLCADCNQGVKGHWEAQEGGQIAPQGEEGVGGQIVHKGDGKPILGGVEEQNVHNWEGVGRQMVHEGEVVGRQMVHEGEGVG